MSTKHERLIGEDLFYCFVILRECTQLPRFFIVPSLYVATYVREQHAPERCREQETSLQEAVLG